MDMLKTLLMALPPDPLVLDIGANEGGYTHLIRQTRPDSLVQAFEPLAEFLPGLRDRFSTDPSVVVWPYGVSTHDHVVEGLCVHEAWTLDRPEHAVRGKNATYGEPTRTVHFVAIDDRAWPLVDAIKIDTDGYEYRVLRGAARTIQRGRPLIYLELSYMVADLGDDVAAYLAFIYETLGYVLIDQSGHEYAHADWLSTPEAYPWHTSYDVLMIPRERVGTFPYLD